MGEIFARNPGSFHASRQPIRTLFTSSKLSSVPPCLLQRLRRESQGALLAAL
jgi:hypothetical protein